MNTEAITGEHEAAQSSEEARVDQIVGQGPFGTFAVAGVATAVVIAIYFAFYFFAYLPRGAVQ